MGFCLDATDDATRQCRYQQITYALAVCKQVLYLDQYTVQNMGNLYPDISIQRVFRGPRVMIHPSGYHQQCRVVMETERNISVAVCTVMGWDDQPDKQRDNDTL